MFSRTPVSFLKEYDLGNLIVPIVWGYAVDVTLFDYFPVGMFDRYSQVIIIIVLLSKIKYNINWEISDNKSL